MTGRLDKVRTKAGGSVLLLLAALLLCVFRCAPGAVLLLAAALLLRQKEPLQPWQLAGFVYLLAVVALICLGRLSYPMMKQAHDLYRIDPSMIYWLKAMDKHTPRLCCPVYARFRWIWACLYSRRCCSGSPIPTWAAPWRR